MKEGIERHQKPGRRAQRVDGPSARLYANEKCRGRSERRSAVPGFACCDLLCVQIGVQNSTRPGE